MNEGTVDDMDEGRPIFVQIAEAIEHEIVDGAMPEGSQVPSINELAAFHRINPATALKGINLLVDQGVLVKRRGVGMFVTEGARDRVLAERRGGFAAQHIKPVAEEATRLGFTAPEVQEMIRKEMQS